MQVFLEMFLWAMEDEGAVRYHHLQTDITASTRDPDVIVLERLKGLGLIDRWGARYTHSTSWRFEAGRTLLTYLVWVEARLLADLPTRRLLISMVKCPRSRGPLAPRPATLHKEQVLAHGLRHLRHLVFDRKDAVAVKTLSDQKTRELIQSLEPAPSGRLGCRQTATVEEGVGLSETNQQDVAAGIG